LRPEPEEASALPRAGLTLLAVKAALQKWQGHMRRGAQLQSEDEFAAALALVPLMPNPPAYLARTLRGLADLCVLRGRLEEAAGLFERVAGGGGRRSDVFWRDYAVLLFRLALKRVAAGQAAPANEALQRAAELLRGPADQPEAWNAAWEGYAETALWFERAGEILPAGLYAEHALAFASRLGLWAEAGHWLGRMAQAGQHRAGAARGLVWVGRLQALRHEGWPGALEAAVRAAVALAQFESSLGREAGAAEIFATAETWLREAGGESPALADLHLGWGLALGSREGRAHLELALSLRRRLLGPAHFRTLEAEQALQGLSTEAPPRPADEAPRAWDGGAQFAVDAPATGAAAELKRLHRRLARMVHPDGAPDADAAWRHELMVRINRAAEVNDLFSLRALMREALARLAADRPRSVAP
jgi:tetratricopeptide (TPR) repeat protein